MSLLSICRAACSTASIAAPVSIIGNEDQSAVLLLGLANDAGEELAHRKPGGWVSMIREFNFQTNAIAPQAGTVANVGNSAVISGLTGIGGIVPNLWLAAGTGIPLNSVVRAASNTTVTLSVLATTIGAGTFSFGQQDYLLPGDFTRSIDNTFWDKSRYWQMRGPLSAQEWQMCRNSMIGRTAIERRFRFRSVFTNGNMIIGDGGVGVASVGGPVQARQVISIDPPPFDNSAPLVFEYVSNGWCQNVWGVPHNEWTADSDVGILDEYLLRLSLKYRLLQRLGMAYAGELDEYERRADAAVAADGGMPTLALTGNPFRIIGLDNIPEGNWPGRAA